MTDPWSPPGFEDCLQKRAQDPGSGPGRSEASRVPVNPEQASR
ncbi:hypothetical protein EYF80_065812 [Liparis tanakae]|uniref:Uncharacterized protein n=1 Tax=Liparis tanakae TaxID=230148 RepID=A0A4Z2E5L6_9TELE|nr:hypothetical protein EYF80_065812 [Liparis tanakae]